MSTERKGYYFTRAVASFITRIGWIGKLIPDKSYLSIIYTAIFRTKIDWNSPHTFNEKIQWLKIYDRKEIYTTMVDKYEVKSFVADRIGEEYVIPTLGVWDHFDDIDFEKLPDQFVLKCTHDSGGLVIVKDKKNLDKKSAKAKIEKCLHKNFYYVGREWPYKNVRPRIIAERLLVDGDKVVPEDYKIYCFDGKPLYTVVFHNRFNDKKELSETVYDEKWNRLLVSFDAHFKVSEIVEKRPESYFDLLHAAETLSTGTPFSRIDFYIVERKIYFGEITLYTASGFQPMIPDSLDSELGEKIKLPHEVKQ